MRRPRPRDEENQDYDSFLDIVANLVGILVILVMVIGVGAHDAWVEAKTEDDSPENTQTQQLRSEATIAAKETANLRLGIGELVGKIKSIGQRTAFRQLERDQLQTQIALAQRELETKQGTLDADTKRKVELQNEYAKLERELQNKRGRHDALVNQQAPTTVLKHIPTPLAKTVFGQEEHFRLTGSRLAYVPINALTFQLKRIAATKAASLGKSSHLTESLGPVDGFFLRYTLQRNAYSFGAGGGTMLRQVVELKDFTLVPTAEDLGEPFDVALQPGSLFREKLAELDPTSTTITVWTYPDSFMEFRQLRQSLLGMGYLTAARPLPAGRSIMGSPQGTRSAAQ